MVERFSERNLWPDCIIFMKIYLPLCMKLQGTVAAGKNNVQEKKGQ